MRQDHKDKLFIFSKTERTLSQPKKMQVFLDSVFLDTNKTNGEIMDELRETRPEYCFSLTRMTLERLLRQHGEGSAETETNLAKIGLLYAYVAMENLHLEDEPWVVVEGEEFEDAKLSGTECQRAYRRRTYIGSAIHPMISYGRFNRHAVRHCDIIECETCQEIYVRSDLAALTGFFPPAVGFNCPRCQNRRIVHAWTTRKKIYASDKSILRQA